MTWLDDLTARVAQARRDAEAATPGPPVLHFAAWSPAAALRHVEHAERVMGRHRLAQRVCAFDGMFWPCPEAVDLAAAWGVEGVISERRRADRHRGPA